MFDDRVSKLESDVNPDYTYCSLHYQEETERVRLCLVVFEDGSFTLQHPNGKTLCGDNLSIASTEIADMLTELEGE